MAKLVTETITITLSKMIKNGEPQDQTVLTEEALAGIISVVEELAGEGVMVEIE